MDPITRLTAIGAAGAGGAGEYWLDQVEYSGDPNLIEIAQSSDAGDPAYFDTNGNIYVVGTTRTSPEKAFIMKRDSAGVVQWARTLSDGVNNSAFWGIASDGTYLYCGGWTYGGTYIEGIVAVYDFNGNLQWQKRYSHSYTNLQPHSISLDSSGSIYFAATLAASSGGRHLTAYKLNNSGVIQWAKGYRYSGYTYSFGRVFSMELDSLGNPHLIGWTDTGAVKWAAFVGKINSSTGALTWSQMYSAATNTMNLIDGIGIDSNDNVYTIIDYGNVSAQYLAKINSSGTLQATASLRLSNFTAVFVDHEDNIIVTYNSGLGFDIYDTSLNFVLGRNISSTPFRVNSATIRPPGTDGIYGGSSNNGNEMFVPLDGSLTGSYSSPYTFTYSSASHTPTSAPAWGTLTGTSSYDAAADTTVTTSTLTDAADSNIGTAGRVYL